MFWVGLFYWDWVPIIGVFIESLCIAGKGYLVSKERVQSESYPKCESSMDVQLF